MDYCISQLHYYFITYYNNLMMNYFIYDLHSMCIVIYSYNVYYTLYYILFVVIYNNLLLSHFMD